MGAYEPPLFWTAFAAVLAFSAWVLYAALLHDRPRGRPRCPKCWYDMTGAPAPVCPECGHAITSPKHLLKTRRFKKRAVAAVLLAATAWYATEVRWRVQVYDESLGDAVVPTLARIAWFAVQPASSSPKAPDASTIIALHRLTQGGNLTAPPSPGWQAWLMTHAMLRVVSEDLGHDWRLDYLARWEPHRLTAVAKTHPSLATRSAAVTGRLWNESKLQWQERDDLLAIALEPGQLTDAAVEALLRRLSRDLEDTTFDRELELAVSGRVGGHLAELYLAEAVRRRSRHALHHLSSLVDRQGARDPLLVTALCALRGDPP
jgi:hypothetical protein